MKSEHEIYETVKAIADLQEARIADLALAVGRQQSALQRSLQGNPTVKLLMICGWALGVDWYWFGLPEHKVVDYKDMGLLRFDPSAPINQVLANKKDKDFIGHHIRGKGPNYDPTDKDMLGSVYPSKALEGAGGQPIDSRFIQTPIPEYDGPTPSHAARRTEDPTSYTGAGQEHPVAATNAAMAQSVPSPAQGPTPTDHELMATEEGRNQLRMRLTDVDCGGWVLSDAALRAGRVPVSQWTTTAGWTIDKMKEHHYLVEKRLLGL